MLGSQQGRRGAESWSNPKSTHTRFPTPEATPRQPNAVEEKSYRISLDWLLRFFRCLPFCQNWPQCRSVSRDHKAPENQRHRETHSSDDCLCSYRQGSSDKRSTRSSKKRTQGTAVPGARSTNVQHPLRARFWLWIQNRAGSASSRFSFLAALSNLISECGLPRRSGG